MHSVRYASKSMISKPVLPTFIEGYEKKNLMKRNLEMALKLCCYHDRQYCFYYQEILRSLILDSDIKTL